MAVDPNMTIEQQNIPEKVNFSTTRQEAQEKMDNALSSLPIRRALAARRGIESVKLLRRHFSLYDMLDLNRPTEARNNQSKQSLTKELRERLQGLFSKRDDTEGHTFENPQNAAEILAEYRPTDVENLTIPLRRIAGIFGNELGIITLPAGYRLNESELTDFYTEPTSLDRYTGDITKQKGMVELGGGSLAIGKVKGVDFETKLKAIKVDLDDAIDVASKFVTNRDKISNTVDFLMYLGVLNYLKTHATTLFHQTTLDERDLNLREDDEIYQKRKNESIQLMERFTRMYYQTLIGLDYDAGFNGEVLKEQVGTLTSFISTSMNESLPPHSGTREYKESRTKLSSSFTVPESSNPIDIALGVLEAVRKNPSVDIIVGIPSGGTESAIVLALMFETMDDKKLPLAYIPISLHSYRNLNVTPRGWARFLEINYGRIFDKKNVLLTDDNSSTGTTLNLAGNALKILGAESIKSHIVDLDISRFEKPNPGEDFFDPSHSPSTLGAISLDGKGNYARLEELKRFLHRSVYGRPAKGAKKLDAF